MTTIQSMTGGCQCGDIRYEVKGEPLTLYACHCSECQKHTSSAFGMSMPVFKEQFTLTRGQPQTYVRRGDGGSLLTGHFCGRCGTRLFHEPQRIPGILNVKPGTLDDTSWIRPVAHIWTDSAQPWVKFEPDILVYPGQPENNTALLEAWATRKP